MIQAIPATIKHHFGELPEPRIERTRLHELLDILVIAMCAVICGANTWEDIADWGHAQEAWLRTCLALPNGIPSPDTFRRVFGMLDRHSFQCCFVS